MFKKNWAEPVLSSVTCLCILLALLAAGCRSVPPLAPVDTTRAGWIVRQGEAVWKHGPKQPELAGDLTLATGPNGRVFVQFTKTPFPIVNAQKTADAWEIQIPIRNQRHSGYGRAPHQIFWLYLPEMLSGKQMPRGWKLEKLPENHWRLDNWATGESLEGYLSE